MNDLAFTDPDRKRYFEDYIPGKSYVLGSVTIDYDEMLAFAKLYDPQDKCRTLRGFDCERLVHGGEGHAHLHPALSL